MVDCHPSSSALHRCERSDKLYSQPWNCKISVGSLSGCKEPVSYRQDPNSYRQESHDPMSQGLLSPSQNGLLMKRFVDLLDRSLQLYDPDYEPGFFMKGALTQLVSVITNQILKDFSIGKQSDALLVAVIVYVEAYINKTHNIVQKDLYVLLITASLLALKYWHDEGVSAKKMARFARVGVKELLSKEIEFLGALNFELHISPAVFSELIN
eukprot:TRINITY_DN3890_c0_g1_i1.p1 TRINITY_DN3890_c0_g1~~TRINITY_DN3890_c0_g1_i1.p1  ORF type:complete len:211 (+),score=33.85 TRINITY_DN3890_c0_g1_i1:171-803(+)